MKTHQFDQAMMDELVAAASQNVWGVPSLRPMQLDAARVMLHPRRPDQIILVQPTGAGKSHIVRLLGVIKKGIVLVFVPLLALSADVLEKFKNAIDTWGTVDVHHLDEVYTNSKGNYRRLLEKIRCMDRRTSSTLFLFVSPHFLVLHPDARDALLLAGRERTLRLVVADEVHLMVQHGMSFRAEIRALRDLFWIKLFRPSDSAAHPKFIGMTATMPEAYVAHLTFLTTLPFPDSNIFRASAYDFQQRSIGMAQFVCGVSDYARTGLKQVVEFLHKNPDRSTVLFTNARARAETLTRQLEAKLNEAHVNADVIVVHGNLDKNEKFWRVRIFCAPQGTHVEDVKCRALVATNAINVGIDDHTVDFGVRFGLPRDLATFIQERGRGSRVPGAPSTFVVFLDLGSYEYLVTRTLRSLDNDDVNATNDTTRGGTQGYNSAISPFKSVGSHDATTNSVDMTSYRLKREGKIRLRDRELQEMGDVTKFFFLNNGCQHILSELYLSHGKFVVPPAELPPELRPCDQQCAICSGKWHQVHLPVYREWVVAMLEIRGRELLPLETLSREDRISNLIWGDVYWTEKNIRQTGWACQERSRGCIAVFACGCGDSRGRTG